MSENLTFMNDSFLLLSEEGREGVLLFHQDLGWSSKSAMVTMDQDNFTIVSGDSKVRGF